MKKYIIAMFACCWVAFCSCSDNDKLPNIRPTDTGEYTDKRDGNTYGWVRIGDLEWMTENLKYQVDGQPYYERTYDMGTTYPLPVRSPLMDVNFEEDYQTYGNCYTWEEAKASCPDGWRLPTDKDWKNLEMALGMSARDADAEGWRGDQEATLLRQDEEGTGIRLLLGGEVVLMNINFITAFWWNYVGEYGYYWSASEVGESDLQTPSVWFRKICANTTTVYRGSVTLQRLMRVRCCRDAGK